MIKSKIDAREKALELAVEWRKAMPHSIAETTDSMAEKFANFLIGDAELPETEPSTEEVTLKAIQQVVEATKSSYRSPAWAVNATMPEPFEE